MIAAQGTNTSTANIADVFYDKLADCKCNCNLIFCADFVADFHALHERYLHDLEAITHFWRLVEPVLPPANISIVILNNTFKTTVIICKL